MVTVRRLLQSAFGFVALIYISASFVTLAHLPAFLSRFSPYQPAGDLQEHATLLRLASLSIRILSVLVITLPLPLAALYCTTWWILQARKTSARIWALAASVVTILQGIPILVLTLRDWDLINGKLSPGFLILNTFPFLIGIPGIVAFARNSPAEPVPAPEPPRVKDDGTSRRMDRFALIVQVAVILISGQLAWYWTLRHRHGARYVGNGIAGTIAELAVIVALHELGHIVGGLLGGMKLAGILLGPLNLFQTGGKWQFRFLRGLSTGATAGVRMIPTQPTYNRASRTLFVAGGPAASLLSGIGFLCWAAAIPNEQSARLWSFCAWTGILSLGILLLNLLPTRSQAFYSDGAKLLQILQRSVLEDYYWVLSLASSVAVTSIRPRDYDLEALRRVVESEVGRPQRVVLHLMESECLFERGLIGESAEAVGKAQAAYEEQAETLTAGTICAFVFGHAMLRSDAAAAHGWFEHLDEGQGLDPEDRLFCSAVLASAEGHTDEAPALLDQFEQNQSNRPPCGSREFNLHMACFAREILSERKTALPAAREAVSAAAELAGQQAY
jgi:hypothetical protein